MKEFCKNIISIILALVFLISSSGFIIYEHHCNTHHISQTSFLFENFDCHQDNENNHLNCNDNSTCCTDYHENVILEKETSTDKENCCETKKSFFKLKSVFEKPVIKNTLLVISKIIRLYKDIVNIDSEKNDNKPDVKPDLKIHLFSGKKLVYLLCQQKIAPSIF